jgi:hypothetical protein
VTASSSRRTQTSNSQPRSMRIFRRVTARVARPATHPVRAPPLIVLSARQRPRAPVAWPRPRPRARAGSPSRPCIRYRPHWKPRCGSSVRTHPRRLRGIRSGRARQRHYRARHDTKRTSLLGPAAATAKNITKRGPANPLTAAPISIGSSRRLTVGNVSKSCDHQGWRKERARDEIPME